MMGPQSGQLYDGPTEWITIIRRQSGQLYGATERTTLRDGHRADNSMGPQSGQLYDKATERTNL